jgi:fission 1 protein
MGETQRKQRTMKKGTDEKLALSTPSRDLLENLAVECASRPSSDNTFQYAFALAKSNDAKELRYAVDILDGLVKEGYEHQVDCLYGAATALYLLNNFEEARVSYVTVSHLYKFMTY